jgi:hypothetical protein
MAKPLLLRSLFALVLAVCFALAGTAHADAPSAADKETARGLMDRGDELTQKGDHARALEAYEGAYAIVKVPTTGTAVARALVALGRYADAKRVADEVVALPAQPNEVDALVRARAEAKRISADAAPRLGRLKVIVIGVPAGATAEVLLDGKSVDAEALKQGYDVDSGKHSISVTAGDRKGSAEASLEAGKMKSITVELAAGKSSAPVTKSQPSGGSGKRTLGFVIGGIGIAGLATAGITGAMLLSRDQQIKDNCPNKQCNPEGRDLINGSKPLITLNAVAWGVGVVGVGVGAYLIFSSKSGSETPTQTAIHPTLLPGGAGVGVARSF